MTALCSDGVHGLVQRFDELTGWLSETRGLWAPSPFVQLPAPWEADLPRVSRWLRGLEAAEVARLEAGERLEDMPPAFTSIVDASKRWSAVEPLAESRLAAPGPAERNRRINARKSKQVRALAAVGAAVLSGRSERHIVDWCAGKSHLGRAVATHTAATLTAIEIDAGLCSEGHELAREAGITCRMVNADVHSEAAWRHLTPDVVVMALHACGALAERLIQQSLSRRPSAVVLAPCCYHRGAVASAPMSGRGRHHALRLDHSALRLATLDDGVARPSVRARRHSERAYRLAFDLLLREVSGRDAYTPLGQIPRAWFAEPFGQFARRVAERDRRQLPQRWSPDEALAAGTARGQRARSLGAMRAQFRRPLELWLVLDRALRLAEGGYAVSVGTFCSRAVTPRNMAVVARA
jgi:hypothetical protein